MSLFSFLRKKRKSKDNNLKRDELKELALKKISQIKKKRLIREKIDYIAFIFKVFIEKKIGIKNNKTHEEIIEILKEKRVKKELRGKIYAIFKLLNELEYSSKNINKKQLEMVFFEIKEVIKNY